MSKKMVATVETISGTKPCGGRPGTSFPSPATVVKKKAVQ